MAENGRGITLVCEDKKLDFTHQIQVNFRDGFIDIEVARSLKGKNEFENHGRLIFDPKSGDWELSVPQHGLSYTREGDLNTYAIEFVWDEKGNTQETAYVYFQENLCVDTRIDGPDFYVSSYSGDGLIIRSGGKKTLLGMDIFEDRVNVGVNTQRQWTNASGTHFFFLPPKIMNEIMADFLQALPVNEQGWQNLEDDTLIDLGHMVGQVSWLLVNGGVDRTRQRTVNELKQFINGN